MAITTSDVVGWWDLQETSGNALDSSAGAHPGVLEGAAARVGSGGPTNLPRGIDFVPATSDRVDFGFDPSQSPGTAIVWVKPDDVTQGYAVIMGHAQGGGGGQFDIVIEGSAIKGRSRYDADEDVSFSAVNGTLYFVAYTWATSGSTGVEIFKDGTSQATNTGTGTIVDGGAFNLKLGTYPTEATTFFDGKIYQAILFNRILTGAEITSLYNSGAGQTYTQAFTTFIPQIMVI